MNLSENIQIESLVRGAQAGELLAFEGLVRASEGPVRAWVAAHCPPGGDVDEVAQRTFIAMFQRLSEFQVGTSFEAWLFTIARFQLMTEVTRLRRLADYHSRYASEFLQSELERRAGTMSIEVSERANHLRACLDELNVDARRFIEWRYTEEIPLQSMAERTGRSVAAIKKQLWLLRQKLQACVEQKLATEARGSA